jgi:hemolysin D
MFKIVSKIWRNRVKLADRRLSEDLKSFLPQALEILERPPHPASGLLLRIVTGIVIAVLLWSVFGKVNIISVAEGKIVPSGKVKQIQPYALGMVSTILVAEGQLVDVGQPLVELDRTQAEADKARLETELDVAIAKSKRLKAMIGLLELKPDDIVSEESVLSHPDIEGDLRNGTLLLVEYNAIRFRRQALKSQLNERMAEVTSNGDYPIKLVWRERARPVKNTENSLESTRLQAKQTYPTRLLLP